MNMKKGNLVWGIFGSIIFYLIWVFGMWGFFFMLGQPPLSHPSLVKVFYFSFTEFLHITFLLLFIGFITGLIFHAWRKRI